MFKTLGKKVPDAKVIEGVISNLSFFAIFNQIKIAQDAKLVRNGGLSLP